MPQASLFGLLYLAVANLFLLVGLSLRHIAVGRERRVNRPAYRPYTDNARLPIGPLVSLSGVNYGKRATNG